MSLKTMPFFGKSGTSRMAVFRKETLSSNVMAWTSPDVETLVAALGHRDALHVLDFRERRAAPQGLLEVDEDPLRRLSDHLHAAVGEVAREAVHAQLLGRSQRVVAEPDSLDTAAHEVAKGR